MDLEELKKETSDSLINQKADWERKKAKNDTSAPSNIALIDYVLNERRLKDSQDAANRSEVAMWMSVVAAAISAIAAVVALFK